jgi:2'-5' RNA ligase
VTSETSASFEDAWRRFRETASVRVGSGIEDEWVQGRAQLLAFMVRILDHRIRSAIAGLVEKLRGLPCLDLYPEDCWHITVKMVGFHVVKKTRPDEVLRRDIGPILYAAERALAGQPPFDVEMGPVNAFQDAIFLEVHDDGRLKALHQRLLAALSRYPRFAQDGDSYLPHLTLARYVSQEGLAALKERLAPLRSDKLGPLPVRRVELVKAWLSGDYPEFDVIQPIALRRPG